MDSLPRQLKALGLLLSAGLALSLASCAKDPRQAAEETLREIGPAVLRRDAAGFYKQLFVAPPHQYFLPKLSDCPPSFQRFRPRRVRAYADGFGLALSDVRGAELGLYVTPLGMDRAPGDSAHAKFQKIDDGIFWYSFAE